MLNLPHMLFVIQFLLFSQQLLTVLGYMVHKSKVKNSSGIIKTLAQYVLSNYTFLFPGLVLLEEAPLVEVLWHRDWLSVISPVYDQGAVATWVSPLRETDKVVL